MPKIKAILDVDPGHDDAVAILLAAKHPALDLQGITVVAGNQILEKTLHNALRICAFAGIETAVFAGMPQPLVREQVIAPAIHGDSGLDGPRLAAGKRRAETKHAVDFIIEKALASQSDLVLIATGPLTNIAVALIREPKIKRGLKKIVLMGGALGLGNVTPSAEFNIFADPEAARIVFQSGVPLTMVGLDLTHQARVTPEIAARIKQINNPVSDLVVELIKFFGFAYKRVYGLESPPLHDVCAVAAVLEPDLLETRKMRVDVETTASLTYGRTVCDFYGVTGRPANAEVALRLEEERFWALLISTLQLY